MLEALSAAITASAIAFANGSFARYRTRRGSVKSAAVTPVPEAQSSSGLERLESTPQCGSAGSKSVSIGVSSFSAPTYSAWRAGMMAHMTNLRLSFERMVPLFMTTLRTLRSVEASWAMRWSSPVSAWKAEETVLTPYAMSSDPSRRAASTASFDKYARRMTLS